MRLHHHHPGGHLLPAGASGSIAVTREGTCFLAGQRLIAATREGTYFRPGQHWTHIL